MIYAWLSGRAFTSSFGFTPPAALKRDTTPCLLPSLELLVIVAPEKVNLAYEMVCCRILQIFDDEMKRMKMKKRKRQ
jgi:hypothetical protein